MRSFAHIFLFIFLFLETKAQIREFHFVQFGDTVKPVDGVVTLAKNTFEIRSTLHDNDVVVTNLTAKPGNYQQIKSGASKEDLDCFGMGKGMSDYPDNSKNWLIVKENDNSYWPYVSKFNRSRFDKSSVDGEEIYVTRTVETLSFLEEDLSEDYTMRDVPVHRLYLIYFVYYDKPEGGREHTPEKGLIIEFM